MSFEVDEAWVKEHYRKMGREVPADVLRAMQPRQMPVQDDLPTPTKRKRKYNNKPTERDGHRFDSVHEANVYDDLMMQVKAGALHAVFCQVPFRLPGEIVYRADFVALNLDGSYTVYDAKSEATRKDKVYRLKKKLMANECGLEIVEL